MDEIARGESGYSRARSGTRRISAWVIGRTGAKKSIVAPRDSMPNSGRLMLMNRCRISWTTSAEMTAVELARHRSGS